MLTYNTMYTRAWDAITVRAQATHRPRGRCVARCAEGAFSAVVGPVRSDFDFPFFGKKWYGACF